MASVLVMVLWSQALVAPRLKYQNRGTYSEGVRAGNSTAPVLDLLGMVVDGAEPTAPMAAQFRVAFFLPESRESGGKDVAITVREAFNRYFYWLDDVQSAAGWRVGKVNQFSWPTDVVVKSLTAHPDGPLELDDLIALVRLGPETNDGMVRVAPAALYRSEPPKEVKGYAFAFRPATDLRFDFSLYPQAGTSLLCHKDGKAEEKVTEWLQCRAHAWGDGWYNLIVNLYGANGTNLTRRIVFFHRRSFTE